LSTIDAEYIAVVDALQGSSMDEELLARARHESREVYFVL
jgi:hypothetical protein